MPVGKLLKDSRGIGLLAWVDGVPCTAVDTCVHDTRGAPVYHTVATLHEHVSALSEVLGQSYTVVGVDTRRELEVLAALPAQLAVMHREFRWADDWLLSMAIPGREAPATRPGEATRAEIDEARAFYRGHEIADNLMQAVDDRHKVLNALAGLHGAMPTLDNARRLTHWLMRLLQEYRDGATTRQRYALDALEEYTFIMAPLGDRCMGIRHVVPWLRRVVERSFRDPIMQGGVYHRVPSVMVAKGATGYGWLDDEDAGRAAMRMVSVMLRSPRVAFGDLVLTRVITTLPRHLAQAFAFMGAAWPHIVKSGYWQKERLLGASVRHNNAPLPKEDAVARLQLARWARKACHTAVLADLPVAVGTAAGEVVFGPSRSKLQLPGAAWVAGAMKELTGE